MIATTSTKQFSSHLYQHYIHSLHKKTKNSCITASPKLLLPLIPKADKPIPKKKIVYNTFQNCSCIEKFCKFHTCEHNRKDLIQVSFKHILLTSSNCHFPAFSTQRYNLTHTVEDCSIPSSLTNWSAFFIRVIIHIKVLQRFNATYPMYGDKVLLKIFYKILYSSYQRLLNRF